MTSRRKPSPLRATAEALFKLLSALAHRSANIAAADMTSGIDAERIAIRGLANSRPQREPTTTRQVLLEALRRGWIEECGVSAEESGREFRLSPAGRTALRAARSERDQIRARSTRPPPVRTEACRTEPDRNLRENPLDWLRTRRDGDGQTMISEAQYAAGERLRKDLSLAGLTPKITMGWSGIPGGGSRPGAASPAEMSDHVLAARQRVTRALAAVGAEHAGILIDVCGYLKGLEAIATAEGWPRRSAKLVLQRSLSALARHYGLLPVQSVEQSIAERLRHWGAPDYRPTLDRWSSGQSKG